MHRSPTLGYALTATAAALFAAGGVMARKLLDAGVSPWRLTEMRSVMAFVLLVAYLALTNRRLLKVAPADLPHLAFLGIFGLAAVQSTYFAAIQRLDIGVALTIQYLAPLLILVVLHLRGRPAPRAMWGAAVLSVAGAFLVVRAYDTHGLDGLGLLAAAGACVTFAINLTASERAGRTLDARTTLTYGFGFCSLLWLVVLPPWSFPDATAGHHAWLALGVGIAGTLVPFLLLFTALRFIPSARAGVVATLEPVIASIIAWPVLDQVLTAPQVVGIVIVVAAVAWVQAASVRPTWPTSAH